MASLAEVDKMALELSESERVRLVANLFESLPPVYAETDSDVEEALRRDAELDAAPAKEIGLDELQARLDSRFTR